MRIVIIGPPASGKSTLTDHLVRAEPDLRTFGVRRHFAQEIEQGTALGKFAEEVVQANGWIPDEVVAAAVRQELVGGRLGGKFILEGMPGNRRQAELLDDLLGEMSLPLHAAVHVRATPQICLERAAQRLVCQRCDGGSHQAKTLADGRCAGCGGPVTRRVTDTPGQFARRLAQHAGLAAELVGYYRGERLIEVDGDTGLAEMLLQCGRKLVSALAPIVR